MARNDGDDSDMAGSNYDDSEDSKPRLPHQNLLYVEESIPKFSGNDPTYTAAKWAQEVKDNTEIFGLTPIQQLLIARRTLTSTAAAWLRTETFKTYKELKVALCREFPSSVSTKQIDERMSNWKKRKDEICYDYMLEMKALGKREKLAYYVVIQYIVEGIDDLERNKMLLYGSTTYPDLKEKLKLYETFKKNMSKQSSAGSGDGGGCDRHKKQGGPMVRCFGCGKINHTSAKYPDCEKGLKCFRCTMVTSDCNARKIPI